MFTIEKNVPMPQAGVVSRSSSGKYAWEKMEVNDSIFVPESEVPADKDLNFLRRRVYNAARKFGDPKGIKFQALVVTERRENPDFGLPISDGHEKPQPTIEVQGVRIWRVAAPADNQTGATGSEIKGGLEAQRETVETGSPSA